MAKLNCKISIHTLIQSFWKAIALMLSSKEKHLCSMPWRAAMESPCTTRRTSSCYLREVLTLKRTPGTFPSHLLLVIQILPQAASQLKCCTQAFCHLRSFWTWNKPWIWFLTENWKWSRASAEIPAWSDWLVTFFLTIKGFIFCRQKLKFIIKLLTLTSIFMCRVTIELGLFSFLISSGSGFFFFF